jgi:predicted secreted protein
MVVVALLGAAACSWAAPPTAPPQNVMSLTASASMEVPLDQLTVVLTAVKEGSEAPLVQTQLRLALDAALAEARKAVRPGQLEVRTGRTPSGSIFGRRQQSGPQDRADRQQFLLGSQGQHGTSTHGSGRSGVASDTRCKSEAWTGRMRGDQRAPDSMQYL